MKALQCFKMSVTSYQLCHNIPEDLNLQQSCCKTFIWVEGNYVIRRHFPGGTCENYKELRGTEFVVWDTNAGCHWFGIREGPLCSSVQHLLHFIQNSGMVLTASHYPSEWTALSLWCPATTGSAETVVLIFVCVHVHWWEFTDAENAQHACHVLWGSEVYLIKDELVFFILIIVTYYDIPLCKFTTLDIIHMLYIHHA